MLLLLLACPTPDPTPDSAPAPDSGESGDTGDTGDADTLRPTSTSVTLELDRELTGGTVVVTRLHETDPTTASFGEVLLSAPVTGTSFALALPVPPVTTLVAGEGGAELGARYLLTVHDDRDGDGVVDPDEPVWGHGRAELLWSEGDGVPFGPGWNHIGFGTSCYAPGRGLTELTVHGWARGDDGLEWTGAAAPDRADLRLRVHDATRTWGDTAVGATFTIAALGTPSEAAYTLNAPYHPAAVTVYADVDGSGDWSSGDQPVAGVCDRAGDEVLAAYTPLPTGLDAAWLALDWICSPGGWQPPGWTLWGSPAPPDLDAGTRRDASDILTLDAACRPDGWP